MKFTINNEVSWVSKSGGYEKLKTETIIGICPAGTRPQETHSDLAGFPIDRRLALIRDHLDFDPMAKSKEVAEAIGSLTPRQIAENDGVHEMLILHLCAVDRVPWSYKVAWAVGLKDYGVPSIDFNPDDRLSEKNKQ